MNECNVISAESNHDPRVAGDVRGEVEKEERKHGASLEGPRSNPGELLADYDLKLAIRTERLD